MIGEKKGNSSSAVMQQRKEPHDSLDDFPTPPWATRSMLEQLEMRMLINKDMVCREPAANRGYMVRPLSECFSSVIASDVHDYGFGFSVKDYLFGSETEVDWTITNPPFKLAQQFIETAIDNSRVGVAVILRSAFLEGVGRYEELFKNNPPNLILQHCERVPMVKGRYDPKVGSATSYCWLIWIKDNDAIEFGWIPQCKKRFEKPEDVI